jgi:hypothetical protein
VEKVALFCSPASEYLHLGACDGVNDIAERSIYHQEYVKHLMKKVKIFFLFFLATGQLHSWNIFFLFLPASPAVAGQSVVIVELEREKERELVKELQQFHYVAAKIFLNSFMKKEISSFPVSFLFLSPLFSILISFTLPSFDT